MTQRRLPAKTPATVDRAGSTDPSLAALRALERKILWLAVWMIHNANHLRDHPDGLKVGGHQASSASIVTLMTALYLRVLRPEDRVAVKPHGSPVLHAIQYLLGHQALDQLQNFRALGGAQSYPSRTKDTLDVDYSTGSVGLGVAITLFGALVQDYVRLKNLAPPEVKQGRLVALVGDAELDEGNVFEAMLEGWKHDVRNVWWVIDYNRQSLDSVVSDRLFTRIESLFETVGWKVVTLKYGKLLEAAFERPGGAALRRWIDNCPNSLYSALTFKGGAAWRERLARDLVNVAGIPELLADHDDAALGRLMTNLAGHDIEAVLEAFEAAAGDDAPTCFIAYTIKGYGLPFAGHKDNHAGLLNPAQMAQLKSEMRVGDGKEWERFEGLDVAASELESFLARVPFAQVFPRGHAAPAIEVPAALPLPTAERLSTQEGFGRILFELAGTRTPLADRIVTLSPDVTVSTNLGGWVNRRGVFDRNERADVFREEKVVSTYSWQLGQKGQHIELGIAENNFFLLMAALGLSGPLFGARLLPIGTLYDPFIERGLDALNYACYQDARFMLVATPSGLTLAPEGGAHQSIKTPLIGMGQDKLTYFEPAFIDELATIMRWGFAHMQDPHGGSVYLRLSTRPLEQPKRALDAGLAAAIIDGAYWLKPPAPDAELAIVYAGAVAPEAIEAHAQILEDVPGAGLLAVTSPDRLHAGWRAAATERREGRPDARAPIEQLLAPLARDAALVTVIDGHPATLSWLGAVGRHRVHALGVDHFGQSADLPSLYRVYGLDADRILDAAAALLVERVRAA
ncbi:MAG TPA: 1-deoxy-D-xylulose-5-phosphate synthase N-terminal domain-containing protein [Candidatus Sulfotelmatobacter sp.]|nr:1-deoxy-D-xylulose-5-phosphate synthase N-terminal domain-containing protein [Candidatus Sulfotelmatobacter sp.]